MKETTILHLRNPMGWHGVEEVIATLAEGSKSKGFRTLIVSFEDARQPRSLFLDTLESRGLSATRLSGKGIRFLRQLMEYVKQERVDILHTHTYKSDLWGLLAARGTGRKAIATVHGWTDVSLKLRMMGKGNRLLLRLFDKVVFPSRHQASSLKSLPHWRKEVIPNGIDLRKRFNPEIREETPSLPFMTAPGDKLAVIGRLSPEKGHAFLFKALVHVIRERPALRLFVIGEGPLRLALKRLAEILGISDHVIFTGYQNGMGAILSRIDLVIAPSLQEGCPLALIEAMACGKRIVASDIGGIREVTEGYGAILWAPPGESQALGESILKGLSCPKEEIPPPGNLSERFSSEKMVEAYLKVYEALLPRSPSTMKKKLLAV